MIENLSDYFIWFTITSASLIQSRKMSNKIHSVLGLLHSEYPVSI